MKIRWLIMVSAAIVGLAACTRGSKNVSPPTTQQQQPSSTATPTTPTPSPTSSSVTQLPTTAATGATTTTATALAFCPPTQLQGTFAGRNGAGGMGFYGLEVTNTGSQPCPAGGFFGVALYDQAGHLLAATDTRDTSFNPVTSFELNPGATATFVVAASENPTGNATSCPLIGAFHLIPPNATSALQVSVPASDNLQYCSGNGSVTVRPTQAGAHPLG